MLLMVEIGIIGRIYHSIYWYAKTNETYMKYHYKNKESSCLKY